jgi:hypothetical protein
MEIQIVLSKLVSIEDGRGHMPFLDPRGELFRVTHSKMKLPVVKNQIGERQDSICWLMQKQIVGQVILSE